MPDNEASTIGDRNYYLTVSDSNFRATSISDTICTSQVVTSDDLSTVQHVLYNPGSYDQSMLLQDTLGNYISSDCYKGDGKAVIGQTIKVGSKFNLGLTNDYDCYSATKFVKFDANAFEPILYPDSSKYGTQYFDGNMTFDVWYVTKKDGLNWIDQSDMNNGNIEDMLLFENIDDIPENYLCIGIYFESNNNGNLAVSTGDNNVVTFLLRIKDSATIGQTYGITSITKDWIDYVDRTKYSAYIGNFSEYPTPTWSSGNRDYIKTEYDENGDMITGTHNGGWRYGQTVLVLGSNLTVSKTSIDEQTGNEKINYDLGKNEYEVTYKITPNMPKPDRLTGDITGVNLKLVDTLPKGLTYVGGSSNELYGEPERTDNSDGTTTLVWYIYNQTVGKTITPLTYKARISEESENGKQYQNTVVVSEVIGDGEISKIGTSYITNRTNSIGIQIINLSSYSLYKTTETPVIEVNGTIHYKITAINKTDDDLADFQLLDILPYNGDSRGTNFNGTYKVDKITIKETNTNTGLSENSNLSLFITNDESVRTSVDVKDPDLGITSIWSSYVSGENLNKSLTAYALVGNLGARVKLEVDIYLKTDGNKPYDLYKNSATAQTNKNTEKIETSVITVQDIKRELYGYIWEDINADGLISENERFLEGIEVSILNEDGSQAVGIHGELIQSTKTDENGYYYFEDMIKGNYKICIHFDIPGFEITAKNVGSNTEVNSKLNTDGFTDTITSLNSSDSPVITESYVNAGISPKERSIQITKVAEENINTPLDGAEFSLFKYIGDKSSSLSNELIDVNNLDTLNWSLVGTYVSDDNGFFSLDNLPIIYEYRLVETKAPDNRMISTGQWKIEFMYGSYDKSDPSLIEIGENVLKITGIENPPAFIFNNNSDSGNLLIPNRLIYEIPVTGGTIDNNFRTIGIVIAILGIIILFFKKVHITRGLPRWLSDIMKILRD